MKTEKDPETIQDIHNLYHDLAATNMAWGLSRDILPHQFYTNNIPRKPWPEEHAEENSFTDENGLQVSKMICARGGFSDTITVATSHREIESQLAIQMANMRDYAKVQWSLCLQAAYSGACGTQLVATDTLVGGSKFPAVMPTRKLDWVMLEDVYGFNERTLKATNTDPTSTVDGKGVLQLLGCYDAFFGLKAGWEAPQGLPIMTMGEPYKFKGGSALCKFETVQFARKHDLVGGVWVERYPYREEALADGSRVLAINPLYINAATTDVALFDPRVMDCLIPKPRPHLQTWSLDRDWVGTVSWNQLPISKGNLDCDQGFFRIITRYASKVNRPELGAVIRVLSPRP